MGYVEILMGSLNYVQLKKKLQLTHAFIISCITLNDPEELFPCKVQSKIELQQMFVQTIIFQHR